MILLIDNYDSFTHNLSHLLSSVWEEPLIRRNDQIGVEEAIGMKPDALILSPGPGRPKEAGIMLELLGAIPESLPVLGICLGYQAMGIVNGARLKKSSWPIHGKTSQIMNNGSGLFRNCAPVFKVARYHSLILDWPKEIIESGSVIIDAKSDDKLAMSMRLPGRPWFGLQFHPESFMSEFGRQMIANFKQHCSAQN
jgi:anthranilate synthase component II